MQKDTQTMEKLYRYKKIHKCKKLQRWKDIAGLQKI